MAQNKKAKPAQNPAAPKESAKKKPVKQRDNHLIKDILSIAVGALVIFLLFKMIATGSHSADVTAAAPSPQPQVTVTPIPLPESTAEITAEPTGTPVPEATAQPLPLTDLSPYTEGGLLLADQPVSELPYAVYVSKGSFTIAVLGIDENGEHTRLLRTWRTAIGTGNKTRAGNYEIDKKYLWYSWDLGGYTPYTSRLADSSIRLHSPLHNKNEDWESLYREGYRQIGSKETQGCLRTTTEGAAWVYYNCPIGTKIIIKNDDLYASEEPPALGDSKSDPTRPLSSDDLEIPVTFFKLNADELSLTAGDTYPLAVSDVQPALSEHEELEEIDHRFIYVSGNENVITVDENGSITAVSPGDAQLLVAADDINKAYRIIHVSVSPN